MRSIKSRRFLFAGAIGILVVVALMSFGERARHGHYHFDGGRGWDSPPSASLDAGHAQLHFVIRPHATIVLDRGETTECLILPIEVPTPQAATLRGWFRLRPPPQA
ncbi:MAG TPA: hypothetical protein VGX94_13410 [Terriglobia bacterium]|nr:hypothetical protein [Terriglobia bacterium]